jgi:hypothetical protein
MTTIKNWLCRFPGVAGTIVGMTAIIFAQSASGAAAPTNIITNASDVTNLFCGALLWMFWGVIVLAVAMFLVGGYTYATSAGDAEKVGKATRTLTYAAIAVVVALVAAGVPVLVGSLFGVKAADLSACGS